MRIAIQIDSATTKEMRALQQAFHQWMKDADPIPLWDHGTSIAVKAEGPSSWTAATPKMPAAEATLVMRSFIERIGKLEDG